MELMVIEKKQFLSTKYKQKTQTKLRPIEKPITKHNNNSNTKPEIMGR
jgi:hypothetical protein